MNKSLIPAVHESVIKRYGHLWEHAGPEHRSNVLRDAEILIDAYLIHQDKHVRQAIANFQDAVMIVGRVASGSEFEERTGEAAERWRETLLALLTVTGCDVDCFPVEVWGEGMPIRLPEPDAG